MSDHRNKHLDDAAERIRRVESGEHKCAVYCPTNCAPDPNNPNAIAIANMMHHKDAWHLAKAYLSNSFYCRKCNGTGRVFVALSGVETCERCNGTGSQP